MINCRLYVVSDTDTVIGAVMMAVNPLIGLAIMAASLFGNFVFDAFKHRAGVTPYTSTYVFAECCVFNKQSEPPGA